MNNTHKREQFKLQQAPKLPLLPCNEGDGPTAVGTKATTDGVWAGTCMHPVSEHTDVHVNRCAATGRYAASN